MQLWKRVSAPPKRWPPSRWHVLAYVVGVWFTAYVVLMCVISVPSQAITNNLFRIATQTAQARRATERAESGAPIARATPTAVSVGFVQSVQTTVADIIPGGDAPAGEDARGMYRVRDPLPTGFERAVVIKTSSKDGYILKALDPGTTVVCMGVETGDYIAELDSDQWAYCPGEGGYILLGLLEAVNGEGSGGGGAEQPSFPGDSGGGSSNGPLSGAAALAATPRPTLTPTTTPSPTPVPVGVVPGTPVGGSGRFRVVAHEGFNVPVYAIARYGGIAVAVVNHGQELACEGFVTGETVGNTDQWAVCPVVGGYIPMYNLEPLSAAVAPTAEPTVEPTVTEPAAIAAVPVQAGPIPVNMITVQASDTAGSGRDNCKPPHQVTYEATKILDNDPATAWRTLSKGQGVYLEFTFAAPVTLTTLHIFAGYGKEDPCDNGVDRWPQGYRASKVELAFKGGPTEAYTLDDVRDLQTITLNQPVTTQSVRLTILETYPPKVSFPVTYAAVSEVGFIGVQP